MSWEIMVFYWLGYFTLVSILISLIVTIQYYIFRKLESLSFYWRACWIAGMCRFDDKNLLNKTFITSSGKKFKLIETRQ